MGMVSDLIGPIEEATSQHFLPALFQPLVAITADFRRLIALPVKLG